MIQRLVKYRSHLDSLGWYKSCIRPALRRNGLYAIAAKFIADADILVPRLIPPMDPLRKALLDRVHRVRSLYFHTLSGPWERFDGPPKQSSAPEILPGGILVSRTEYLQRYLDAQKQGTSIVEQAVERCDLRELVSRSVRRLKTMAETGVMPNEPQDRPWHSQGTFLEADYLAPPE